MPRTPQSATLSINRTRGEQRGATSTRQARKETEVVMRNVVLYMSMSLDGFVGSDREHPGIAIPEDGELKRWKLDAVSKAGAHLMGRATYQEMSSYWPQSQDAYAAPMNDVPKVVFSTTVSDAEATWPVTRVARGDLATEIAAIKAEPGADVIVWGGGRFAGALAAADLVDEYRPLGPAAGPGPRPGPVRPTAGLAAPGARRGHAVPQRHPRPGLPAEAQLRSDTHEHGPGAG